MRAGATLVEVRCPGCKCKERVAAGAIPYRWRRVTEVAERGDQKSLFFCCGVCLVQYVVACGEWEHRA